MTRDGSTEYDASRVGLWGGAAMAAISAILMAIDTWRWPMIGAFLSACSLLIIGHTQISRPWLRRRKLKRPFRAHLGIVVYCDHDDEICDQGKTPPDH
jgi:hypothetical protein